MSSEKNKAIIHRLIETENKHNLTLLDELIAPDFVDERNTPFELRGLEVTNNLRMVLSKRFPIFISQLTT